MMNLSERRRLEQSLLEERERATRAFHVLRRRFERADWRAFPALPCSGSADTAEAARWETISMLATQGSHHLARIDEALFRLRRDDPDFGDCVACGGAIALERLSALSNLKFCLACMLRGEAEGRIRGRATARRDG
jgi:RNA polymerase-binding transcription factor DksA